MKKIILITLLFALVRSVMAQSITINGIEYYLVNGSMTCKLKDESKIECVILPEVQLEGITYKVTTVGKFGDASYGNNILQKVTLPNTIEQIEKEAFACCEALKSIVIPNTVKRIGMSAFSDCKNLKSVTLPDNAILEPWYCNSTQETYSPFEDCIALSQVTGTTVKYPKYIIEGGLKEADRIPFVRNIPTIKSSFLYYVTNRVKDAIVNWEKKGEYETSGQWQERVTEKNRNSKVKNLVELAKKEYIKQNMPEKLSYTIGTYDADHELYPIYTSNNETFFAQVPIKEAPFFKSQFSQVKISPVFDIKDDRVGIVACTFNLKGKIYNSPAFYAPNEMKEVAINLPPLQINIGNASQGGQPLKTDDEVDKNIPVSLTTNNKKFAVIIGNENYQRVSKVSYALNDAQIFAAYCQKTLGIPINNIRRYKDATYGTMLSALKDIKNIANAYNGDISIIFYYAGHGVPNEANKNAYLLPIDADGTQPEVCLATSRLYQELEALHVRSVVVFMDACFSGAQRGEGMLASARGVALKVNTEVPQGNIVVFSAASGDETAFPYKEKGHGMFTYFLLKKLQESKGEAALGELGDYIITNVKQQSVVVNHKSQTPTVVPSVSLRGNWETMKLK